MIRRTMTQAEYASENAGALALCQVQIALIHALEERFGAWPNGYGWDDIAMIMVQDMIAGQAS